MSLPEKVLMRKIRKREQQKVKLLQLKEADKLQKDDAEQYVEAVQTHSKRKLSDSEEESESETEDLEAEDNSESDLDEGSNSQETHLIESTENQLISQSSTSEPSRSDRTFDTLSLQEKTLKALADMGINTMTDIQAQTIPMLLKGKHISATAKTGSGKTLAFLIPAVELVYKIGFKHRNGTGVIILSPTRELALQTFGVLKELMKYYNQTCGIIMGGGNRAREAQKLFNGINVLVATPGRLLDHMRNTSDFVYKNTFSLIIDEADRIFDIGFEDEIKQIVKLLPKTRQTVLFSATRSEKVELITAQSLKQRLTHVKIEDPNKNATVAGLNQGFIVIPTEKRLLALYSFLIRVRRKKVMVFFSSCMSVEFHRKLFNYIDLKCMYIHGKQKQAKRTATFFRFSNATSGLLLCTDVAARGLDIPAVDWIIQYDPPEDPREYIHRVGRTARGEGGSGRAMLMLRPEELNFLWYLQEAKVPLNEMTFKWELVDKEFQPLLESLIGKNWVIRDGAKAAFQSYVRSFESSRLKDVYSVEKLDMDKVARSFGFYKTPNFDGPHVPNRAERRQHLREAWGTEDSKKAPNRAQRRQNLRKGFGEADGEKKPFTKKIKKFDGDGTSKGSKSRLGAPKPQSKKISSTKHQNTKNKMYFND